MLPDVVRYASSMTLDIRIQDHNPELIYIPVLTITYTDVRTEDVNSAYATTVEYSFNTRYSMDVTSFRAAFKAVTITAIVLSIVIFLIRLYNWRTRNLRPHIMSGVNNMSYGNSFGSVDINMLIEVAAIGAHSWVMVCFPIIVLSSAYWFTFFKLQDTVSIMLPPMEHIYDSDSTYYYFTSMLHLIFFFQTFYIMRLVYKQCNADIFFIDWEPSKRSAHKESTDKKSGDSGVSVWRTILVANEWTEMQTLRKTDIRCTLFFIGFFLLGLDLEYNATQQPDLSDVSEGQLNIVLRFANVTWWWFIISLAQYLWKFLLYERYISEPYQQSFVDACTIAKISIIVLPEPYWGYYLHCRSPHQFADGSMPELVSMLHKEEAGLSVDRSLQGATTDDQSFQLFLSGEWRMKFAKIQNNILQNNPSFWDSFTLFSGTRPNNRHNARSGLNRSGNQTSGTVPDKMLRAHTDMTTFLQSFIDNNLPQPEMKRTIQDTTYFERMCNIAPDLTVPGQPSVMRPDPGYDFTKVTFLGIELDLLVFNILTYCMFDLWLNNTALSILMTYLIDFCLCYIRESYGQVNYSILYLIIILCDYIVLCVLIFDICCRM
jgi:meckelin